MVRACAVQNCPSKYKSQKELEENNEKAICFHKFPISTHFKEIWVQQIKTATGQESVNTRKFVCELHFDQEKREKISRVKVARVLKPTKFLKNNRWITIDCTNDGTSYEKPTKTITEVCRICLSSSDLKMSLSAKHKLGETLSEVINYVAGIDTQWFDDYPQKVCFACLKNIEIAYRIKKTCIETDRKLRNHEDFQEDKDESDSDAEWDSPSFVDVSMETIVENVDSKSPKKSGKLIKLDITPQIMLGPLKKSDVPPGMLDVTNESPTNNQSPRNLVTVGKRKADDRETYFYCELCREVMKTVKQTYLNHIQQHIKNQDNPLQTCETCQEKLYCRSTIEAHPCFKKKDQQVSCLVCGEKSLSLNKLFNHMIKEHRRDGVYRCPKIDCPSEPFLFPKNMHYHIESHVNPIPRICSYCGVLFQDQFLYKMHCLKHENRIFYCDMDGREFFCKNRLRVHMASHVNRGQEYFKCKFCSITYMTLGKLQRHEANKHGSSLNYQCEKCGKWYVDEKHLNNHVRTHDRELPQCGICSLKFNNKQHLKYHVDLVHVRKTDHQCHYCKKYYLKGWHLTKHIQKTHDKQKNYNCSYCNWSCFKKHDYIIHTRGHTNQRPYICYMENCLKRYKDVKCIRMHLKSFHKISDPDISRCIETE